MQALIADVDHDKDGAVDFDEFCKMMEDNKARGVDEDALKKAFDHFRCTSMLHHVTYRPFPPNAHSAGSSRRSQNMPNSVTQRRGEHEGINPAGLAKVLEEMGEKMSEEDIQEIFEAADTNNVSHDEARGRVARCSGLTHVGWLLGATEPRP